jgi:hypothetical protein
MAIRATVYSAAAMRFAREAGPCNASQVTNVLATVATNNQAFVRHASGAAEGTTRATGSNAGSGECVTEGGGESLESGGKAGIDRSYIGLQPKRSARKRFVRAHLDRLRVETGALQRLPKYFGVQRVRIDGNPPRSACLVDCDARQVRDAAWLERERGSDQPLCEEDGDRNDPILVARQVRALAVSERDPPRGDPRFGFFPSLARDFGRCSGRFFACLRDDRRGPRPRLLHDALCQKTRFELFASDAPRLRRAQT